MEIQFEKSVFSCLKWNVHTVHYQEVTQDIRVSDDMPDVGRILGAWGQVLLRGKEWSSTVGVSGGVMVWVLYLPEGGNEPCCLESWLPFQGQWDLPNGETNGKILCKCSLRSLDARSASARKIIVRGCIGIQCDAVTQSEITLYTPTELPEDLQVLRQTYPITRPTEAGEKAFTLDETLTLPGTGPKLGKILRYTLQPEIVDQKILAGKAVFRGMGILHLLYAGEDGQIYSSDFDIPFSQYTELDAEYEETAEVSVFCETTNLELEADAEGVIHLRAGLTGQYLIYDQILAEVVTDAYSPVRTVTMEQILLEIPAVLERKQSTVTMEQVVGTDLDKVIDVACLTDCPDIRRSADRIEAGLPSTFTVLYYDQEGNLQGASVKTEKIWDMQADPDCQLHMLSLPSGRPQQGVSEKGIALRMDCRLHTSVFAGKGVEAVSGMMLGEVREPDAGRPSLILRRAGNDTVWEIAKQLGSTVDAIMKANQLEAEPAPEMMLLVPVQ